MNCNGPQLKAWIGAGICGECYEVGRDLVEQLDPVLAQSCLTQTGERWLFDLKTYISKILGRAGIVTLDRADACTFHGDGLFSYRRDGQTGRFATVIGIAEPPGP